MAVAPYRFGGAASSAYQIETTESGIADITGLLMDCDRRITLLDKVRRGMVAKPRS